MNSDSVKVLWQWEVRDRKRRTGWRQLVWMMSEDNAASWARANCAEIRRIEGSREERRDVDARYPGARS